MLMKNLSDRDLLLPASVLEGRHKVEDGKVRVSPGQEVECRDGYCWPRRAGNGSRQKSIIEQYCPGMAPADASLREQWEQTPDKDWEPPEPAVTAANLVAAGTPPAVAALAMEQEAEDPAEPPKEEEKPRRRRAKRSPAPSEDKGE